MYLRAVLTERELQVLKKLGSGLTKHPTGRVLGIGETTVKNYVSWAGGVASRVQTTLIAHTTFTDDRGCCRGLTTDSW
ncbi:hypothetical protein DQ353_04400 [Arthrobacter sp. AQ5-05]|uniref:LuxR C-terminal-related transcriptional regulator n=1 Tax=Arthrobacter sp. AQ5-05 TaxID=2184581 RepID=UPI000DCE1342|nr:LuxR C-terminal-related transcriptional regulator [Arthrobacter sp. AQ5-05]RAX50778.1 hypothetical protein DQ353_04400 [Arthrobacter sp. AQ5-05]